jgi:serine/threonine protein kinase
VRSGEHAASADIWAIGCSVVQLISGRIPWDEEDTSFSALFKIGNGQHPKLPENLSPEAEAFLLACFQPAETRPSAQELLSHPFVADLPPAGPM